MSERADLNKWVDSTAWTILERIATIVEHFSEAHKHTEHVESPPSVDFNRELRTLGHDIINVSAERRRCSICYASWGRNMAKHLVNLGPCIGRAPFESEPDLSLRPWRARRGAMLSFNGKQVHPSHRLSWLGGCFFGQQCGSYSIQRVKGLDAACNVKPADASARSRLKRMQAGKHPTYEGVLPDLALPDKVEQFVAWWRVHCSTMALYQRYGVYSPVVLFLPNRCVTRYWI